MKREDCYQLGNVIKAHGLNGEIQIYLDVDTPAAYQELESVFILTGNKLIPFFIDTLQINGNKALTKLEGVDSREEAEALAGNEVHLPLAALPQLEENQYYYHEIIGFEFFDNGKPLGIVENVIAFSAQTLLTIKVDQVEVLVPLQDEIIVSVDKESRQVQGNLPEGLLDVYLNEDNRREN